MLIRIVNNRNEPLKSSLKSFNTFLMEFFSKIVDDDHICSDIFEVFFFVFKFINQFSDSPCKRFYVKPGDLRVFLEFSLGILRIFFHFFFKFWASPSEIEFPHFSIG